MTRSALAIAATLALAVTLPAVPANAQGAIRTYVSITGNDSNPCSLTAPCRHFQAAANATAAGGEVDALDPGGYGSLTINQAITIDGEGWSYVAPANNGNAITVNAGSGNVTLRGLSLNGVGTTAPTASCSPPATASPSPTVCCRISAGTAPLSAPATASLCSRPPIRSPSPSPTRSFRTTA